MKRIRRITSVAAAIVLALAACSEDVSGPEYEAVYEVEVNNERFRIALQTAAQIAKADSLLASGVEQNLHGTLRRGNGGFNMSYSWHLDPSTVAWPDLSMEVCDGRPNSEVEAEVDYYVDTIQYYCPWGAKIVAKVQ